MMSNGCGEQSGSCSFHTSLYIRKGGAEVHTLAMSLIPAKRKFENETRMNRLAIARLPLYKEARRRNPHLAEGARRENPANPDSDKTSSLYKEAHQGRGGVRDARIPRSPLKSDPRAH